MILHLFLMSVVVDILPVGRLVQRRLREQALATFRELEAAAT